ncbi:serine/threonine protein kinase [Virgibacillus phasianinus]|nr:serine/threonine-protein kinase [Virgibacillus phasianinus]
MKVVDQEFVNGKYKVIRYLRDGGTSQLYEVKGPKGQTVILKVVKQPTTLFIDQLNNEAKILANINHPNIPKLYDKLTLNRHYHAIVIEKIDGESIADLVEKKDKKFSWEESLHISKELAKLIHIFHLNNPAIVIRDIKPSNILLTKQNDVYLIDFGTSMFLNDANQATALGTIGFAAPEQFENGVVDLRSDQFSLGATIFFMLTRGQNIYTSNRQNILDGHIPKAFVKVISKLTETDVTNRYDSIEKVLSKLGQVKVSWWERKKKFI